MTAPAALPEGTRVRRASPDGGSETGRVVRAVGPLPYGGRMTYGYLVLWDQARHPQLVSNHLALSVAGGEDTMSPKMLAYQYLKLAVELLDEDDRDATIVELVREAMDPLWLALNESERQMLDAERSSG